jgi:hypothetical protein
MLINGEGWKAAVAGSRAKTSPHTDLSDEHVVQPQFSLRWEGGVSQWIKMAA